METLRSFTQECIRSLLGSVEKKTEWAGVAGLTPELAEQWGEILTATAADLETVDTGGARRADVLTRLILDLADSGVLVCGYKNAALQWARQWFRFYDSLQAKALAGQVLPQLVVHDLSRAKFALEANEVGECGEGHCPDSLYVLLIERVIGVESFCPENETAILIERIMEFANDREASPTPLADFVECFGEIVDYGWRMEPLPAEVQEVLGECYTLEKTWAPPKSVEPTPKAPKVPKAPKAPPRNRGQKTRDREVVDQGLDTVVELSQRLWDAIQSTFGRSPRNGK